MTTAKASPKLPPSKLFINGQWVDASGGRTLPTVNPATEEVITQIAEASQEDVDRAVKAARAAFDSGKWSERKGRDRGKILWKIGELLRQRTDEVALLETLDNGKPIFESGKIDVPFCAECFQYYAGWAGKHSGDVNEVAGNFFNFTLREPVGVIGAIVPWNFPLLLTVWKVAPALAMGNTVVLKPSKETSLTALKLAEICQEAGLPDGVLNVVTGPGSTVGAALVKHPMVDKIAFTGDTSTGKEIMRSSAETLKRVTLELGGKSPNIVLDDADIEAAARGATTGIFYGKGEVCGAGSRLLVAEKAHDALMEQLLDRTKRFQPGDPLDPKTRLGALVNRDQLTKVSRYVEEGKQAGAALVAGGGRWASPGGKGFFFQPTIFDRVEPSYSIAREEIFGPVLSVISFKDLDDLVAKANQTIYGLAAGVWSRDIKKAMYVARKLRAGTVWINTYNMYDTGAPWGGFKQSGFGRELGPYALESYTEVKSVWVDMNM
ncbi:MAG: aldehyde dehydrogenase family protein [Chloroflexi bacterium]|nr:aldehyde dehydrogenase family protein [Chloroflexota bacterium]